MRARAFDAKIFSALVIVAAVILRVNTTRQGITSVVSAFVVVVAHDRRKHTAVLRFADVFGARVFVVADPVSVLTNSFDAFVYDARIFVVAVVVFVALWRRRGCFWSRRRRR